MSDIINKMKKLNMPTHCPSCNTALVWKGVDLTCTNNDCPSIKLMSLASFLEKCGVENVTETSLSNWGITGFRSMLHFKSDGSKSQTKFMSELLKKVFSKTKEDLFACMTFDGAGETNIQKLFAAFGSLETTTQSLYIYDNVTTPLPDGIGEKTIAKIKEDWNRNVYLLSFIIKDARWNPVAKVVVSGNLSGKTFLITGTLTKGRKEFETMIKDNGGIVASSVSKSLNYLLVGSDAGSKLDKAKKLGINIITEDEFMGMI